MLAPLLAAAIAASAGIVAPPAPAAASSAPSCVGVQGSAAAAAAMAAACGQRVEDLAARTEDSQTFANPDGTRELNEYLLPRWAKRPDKSWAPVDTTLRVVDGRIVPGNTVVPVSFSAGGSAPLARLVSGGRELAVSWPQSLPGPVINGDSATYPNVYPDIDLRVTATATGFSEVLIVKTRQAAAHPALRKVQLGYSTKGVTVAAAADGGAEARDPSGVVVFASPMPIMWDSRGSGQASVAGLSTGAAQSAAATETAALPRVAVMAEQVDRSHISVIPDQTMLAHPDTVYPVYVDPSWSGGLSGGVWKMVANRSDLVDSSTFTLNNGSTKGDAGAGRTCDGTVSGGVCPSPGFYLVRSMFRMDLSGVVGKHVLAATFNVTQKWSSTCNPASNARLWLTGGITSSTSWNTQPSWNSSYTADAPASHRVDGAASCAGAGNVAFNALSMATYALGQGANNVTVGLGAIDEGTMNHWKRFDRSTVSLAITYNSYPNVPDTLGTHGQGCTTGSGRPLVAVGTPTLSARVIDPDGAGEGDINGVLNGEFAWEKWNPSTSTWSAVGSGQGTPQAGGTTNPSPAPTFGDGIWRWRARAADSWSMSGAGSGTDYSDWSGWCELEVDTVKPNTATVTPDADNSPFVAGKTIRLNLSPGGNPADTDVTGYNWWVVDGAGTHPSTWVSGTTATVDWTPIAGQGNIYVQAQDRIQASASNGAYAFNAAQPSTEVARWPLNDAAGSTTATDITGNGHDAGVTLNGGSALGAAGRTINGATTLSLNGAAGNTVTATVSQVDTSKSFAVAAWVKIDHNPSDGVVLCMQTTLDCSMSFWYDAEYEVWGADVGSEGPGRPGYGYGSQAGAAPVGVWTHLALVYDSAAHTLVFYVDGENQGDMDELDPFNHVPGSFHIGGDGRDEQFTGSIADVRLWNRAVSAAEIANVVDPTSPANMPTDMVGQWLVEPESCFGVPVTCQDGSDYAHDINLSGGIATTSNGHTGSGLQAGGTDGVAQTTDPNTGSPGPVLQTGQSFTISAWVKLDDADLSTPGLQLPSVDRMAIGQSGSQVSGFYLGYSYFDGEGTWQFAIPEADIEGGEDPQATGHWGVAQSGAITTADVGRWVHLIGTYNAATGELRLYVDGSLAGSDTREGAVFDTSGPLTIGCALSYEATETPTLAYHWNGAIDTVIAYQGVVPETSISRVP